MCRCGGSVEMEEHVVTTCPMYQDLRQKHGDLDQDSNLEAFFREALARRDEFDKKKEQKENERAPMVAG